VPVNSVKSSGLGKMEKSLEGERASLRKTEKAPFANYNK